MQKTELTLDSLKEILENIHAPEKLAAHPWTKSLFVQDALTRHLDWVGRAAGWQLLQALAERFQDMQPATPPKVGLRVDAHWSRFGFLAAKYFAPILRGERSPERYQDVWAKIDESILFFVFGETYADEEQSTQAPYRLLANEPAITPTSTLSDWHKKGLDTLLEVVQARESYLADVPPATKPVWYRRKASWLGIALLLVLIWGGLKFLRVYQTGKALYADVSVLRSTIDDGVPPIAELAKFAPLLEDLQVDLAAFRVEVDPYLWLAPALRILPKYGCEASQAKPFLDLATHLTDAGVFGYQAGSPILEAFTSEELWLMPSVLIDLLLASEDTFEQAAQSTGLALAARDEINDSCLSTYVGEILHGRLDPLLGAANDGLTLAVEFSRLVGATSEGPKTYLLLAQNADELRPSGGFITAAGTLLIQNGEITSLNFENSSNLDDWTKPYPAAPWQLRQYMNSPVLVFRDSNWFPDFPTSALYAEYLYSYVSEHSVDGVIAFNQYFLANLLTVLGPITIADYAEPIGANNVVAYMREAKIPSDEDRASADWDENSWGDKRFIRDISAILLEKLFAGDVDMQALGKIIFEALDEHQLVVQMDDIAVMDILSRRGWDGAIRAGDGDFLLVLDSNIGFNKANAVIETSLIYDVNLTDLEHPQSNLAVLHTSTANSMIPCVQWSGYRLDPNEKYYPTNRCYWDYMRIYTPIGTSLLDSNPQTIPADWMIRRQTVPAQVDLLDQEFDDLQGFGLLKVVPGDETLISNLQFALPTSVVASAEDGKTYIYRLRVQKQAGTVAHPLTLRVHLAKQVEVLSVPAGAIIQGSDILIETDLRLDREFEIRFQYP